MGSGDGQATHIGKACVAAERQDYFETVMICIYIYVCVCIYLFIYLFVYLFTIFIYYSLVMFKCIYNCIYIYIHLSINMRYFIPNCEIHYLFSHLWAEAQQHHAHSGEDHVGFGWSWQTEMGSTTPVDLSNH